jgi:hypothetical protein
MPIFWQDAFVSIHGRLRPTHHAPDIWNVSVPQMSLTRSLSSFVALALAPLSLLSVLAAGCDEAAKALDANNAQPGEADSRAVELTTSPSRFNSIAIDDANMIVVQENGDVHQRAKSNTAGAINKLGHFNFPPNSETFDAQVAFDKDFIYVVTDGGGLYRMPRAGGDGEKLDEAKGQSLALAANSVFYISSDAKSIRKLDKASKDKSDYATGFERAIAVALDGDKVWIADRDAETISWIPTTPTTDTTTATPTVVVKDQSHPNTLGLGPDHIYWSNGSLSEHKDIEDKIFRAKKDGSGTPELVTPTEATFVHSIMHADDQFLYFGQSAGGIMRVPVNASGGAKATKFLNICENGFALSADSIYAVENNANRWAKEDKSKPNRLMAVTK